MPHWLENRMFWKNATGDILDQIDEVDEIGKEIEESSEFGDRVIEAITRLET